ncbi:MAG: DUF4932 domain-containing protein [Bacillota bacterium]
MKAREPEDSGRRSACFRSLRKPLLFLACAALICRAGAASYPGDVLYNSGGDPQYIILTCKSVDLYLVAAWYAPNASAAGIGMTPAAEMFFDVYSENGFIGKLDSYIPDGNAMGKVPLLLMHADLPSLAPLAPVTYGKNEEDLIKGLRRFYEDTKADEFFRAVGTGTDGERNSFLIKRNVQDTKNNNLLAVLKEAESYAGNIKKYYGSKKISYYSVMSPFAKTGAGHRVDLKDQVIFVDLQSINELQFAQAAVHDFLHCFLSPAVDAQKKLISELSKGKDVKDYTISAYELYSWDKIFEECLVRAVQARIYKKVFGEDRAISDIIEPEEIKGVRQLEKTYKLLEGYEKDRAKYPAIEDFIHILIKEYFTV